MSHLSSEGSLCTRVAYHNGRQTLGKWTIAAVTVDAGPRGGAAIEETLTVRNGLYYTPVLEQTTNTQYVSGVQYSCDSRPSLTRWKHRHHYLVSSPELDVDKSLRILTVLSRKWHREIIKGHNYQLFTRKIRKFKKRFVTRFGKMSRKSPKVELRYGPRKSE